MKKSVWIGILVFALMNVGVFYYSYRTTYNELQQTHAVKENMETGLAVEAAVPQETITTADTQLVVESYDMQNGVVKEESEKLPVAYLACTRAEIEELLASYANEPSLDDLEAGFIDAELRSFSAEKLVVRKIYDSSQAGNRFCVMADRGMLTVYYVDKKTVYEYTTIPVALLPNSVQLEVAQGKYFATLEQLFAFLETYSS